MKNKVLRFHMAIGVDLIGSKTSMAASRNVELEATAIGIRMYSKTSNRVVVIPYSNVKGFELAADAMEPEGTEFEELPPKKRGRPVKAQG